jgi:DNA-binding GntR family transcriptional regulator
MSNMAGRTAKQIADQFEEEIRTNVRQPRSQLPSQNVLAAQLGVHRSTVASAYAYLRERGLISPRHGAGTFVAEADQVARAIAARDPVREA